MFPNAILAFSEMIPSLIWSPSGKLFYLDRIRRCLNRTIHNFLVSSGGMSFRHVELEGFVPGLFHNDLVHLSEIRLKIFNMGLQHFIERATVLGGLSQQVPFWPLPVGSICLDGHCVNVF